MSVIQKAKRDCIAKYGCKYYICGLISRNSMAKMELALSKFII